jgi:PIN domain nuclease of toxin-antitoxin system
LSQEATILAPPPGVEELPHRDAAARFLAATAQVMDLTLAASDDLLLGLGTIRTMKN